MKPLAVKLLREIGLDTPNAEAVVTFKLMSYAPDFVHAVAEELRTRQRDSEDSRQGWLALPEYQHIPVEAARDSLEDLRARIARLERRIKSYNNPRRSPERLKADKQKLRALKRLEAKVVPYFAGAPDLTLGDAVPMLQASLGTPITQRNRMLASKGGAAKSRRTKNQ